MILPSWELGLSFCVCAYVCVRKRWIDDPLVFFQTTGGKLLKPFCWKMSSVPSVIHVFCVFNAYLISKNLLLFTYAALFSFLFSQFFFTVSYFSSPGLKKATLITLTINVHCSFYVFLWLRTKVTQNLTNTSETFGAEAAPQSNHRAFDGLVLNLLLVCQSRRSYRRH